MIKTAKIDKNINLEIFNGPYNDLTHNEVNVTLDYIQESIHSFSNSKDALDIKALILQTLELKTLPEESVQDLEAWLILLDAMQGIGEDL